MLVVLVDDSSGCVGVCGLQTVVGFVVVFVVDSPVDSPVVVVVVYFALGGAPGKVHATVERIVGGLPRSA